MGGGEELGDVASALVRIPGWLTYGLAITAAAIQLKRGFRNSDQQGTNHNPGGNPRQLAREGGRLHDIHVATERDGVDAGEKQVRD